VQQGAGRGEVAAFGGQASQHVGGQHRRPGHGGVIAPRRPTWTGHAAAALIATGVLIPLGLGAASLTNVAGSVL